MTEYFGLQVVLLVRIHHLGTLDICTKIHGNASSRKMARSGEPWAGIKPAATAAETLPLYMGCQHEH